MAVTKVCAVDIYSICMRDCASEQSTYIVVV
jgi:hypothetical protein